VTHWETNQSDTTDLCPLQVEQTATDMFNVKRWFGAGNSVTVFIEKKFIAGWMKCPNNNIMVSPQQSHPGDTSPL
jgi:hypothetical protein